MIWTTAKLTEVKSRHRAITARAAPPGSDGRRTAGRSAVRVATGRRQAERSGPGRDGGTGPGRDAAGRGNRPVEVGDEVLDVLQPHAHPEQPGHDPGGEQLGLRELAL